ncbi:MAG: hypothetical protein NTZ73_03510 [Candidatus Diapherotrites archaeon]|nr:hypothetical protein [Candidatus Diapherotrites archaeon]
MSVPIIMKTGVFTLIVCLILAFAALIYGKVEVFVYSALIVIIFFLVLDTFEREAVRLGKKV